MGPANNKHYPSTSKLPKRDSPFPLPLENLRNPSTSSDTEDKNPNPSPTPTLEISHLRESDSAKKLSLTMGLSEDDSFLSKSEFLTRQEVIQRRSRRVKQLANCYKNHYWALMEELKVQHREYYWKYGKSPFEEKEERENGGGNGVEGSGENNDSCNNIINGRLGLGFGDNSVFGKGNGNNRCAFAGCKLKAMALTNFCHTHILSDTKQKLYKACTYVIKSAHTGPVFCGKPILRSTVPSLCTVHFQKAQTHVTRALKKAGLNNISSSSKLAPKFHVIITESVRQIQAKRRAARRATLDNAVVKEENAG